MEEIHRIKYDGKTYIVNEPTLDVWMRLNTEIEFSTDSQLAVTLISWITGLTDEEIRDADSQTIIDASTNVLEYYTNQSKKFYETFEFNGKTFKFIDLKNLTFGEYIDIDTFLQKNESYRAGKLNELMSMLYRETDDKGKYLPYDVQRIKEVSVEFNKLPLKYLNGALVFFWVINNISLKNTPSYFQRILTMLRRIILLIVKTLLGGTLLLYTLLKRTFYRLRVWLKRTI